MTEAKYHPGLEGVIAGETAISSIADGLRYRGYTIDALADQAMFEEVAYLILYGELPTVAELKSFHQQLIHNLQIDPDILEIIKRIPKSAPLMDVMRTGASLLAHWDYEVDDSSREANLRKTSRLLAGLPVIMAARLRHLHDLRPMPPQSELSLAGNILWLIKGEMPNDDEVNAMDVSLILYAEHELNASTFTSRVVASTLSDLHSSITAAIGALKGPLHGGANERVLDVLQEVGSSARAEAWIRDALAQKKRIMGFGHRVYKTGDPRARYLKNLCAKLAVTEEHQEIEKMADIIETIVVNEKGLPPNLDWPSARLYYYLGLPVELYTPLFVVSRVVGWSAHVIEQLENNRIIRPRSRYTGEDVREWVPIELRK